MVGTGAAVGQSKGLVMSDNDRLARAIALTLHRYLGIEMVDLGPGTLRERKSLSRDVDFGLIVLALSLADSEPLKLLSKASLGHRLGRVPTVIISERVFSHEPGDKIVHLNFPYDLRELCAQAGEMLREDRAT